MKILKCIICKGEIEIINNDGSINKKVKCLNCGFTNVKDKKEPEIIIIKKIK